MRAAARASLLTDRSGPGDLDEGDTAFAEQFAADVATLAETLGFPAFRSTSTTRRSSDRASNVETNTDTDDALFRYVGEARFSAQMRVALDDFVLPEGSQARLDETPGCAESIRTLRARARAEGILVPDATGSVLRLTRDFAVGSTSAAGGLIAGRNSRGPNEWVHVRTGRTYAQWVSSKQASAALPETSQ